MAYRFVKSPYWQSRNGKPVDGVVIHTTVGFYEGTIAYFQKNDRSVSSHYVVSLTGDITQMVGEEVGANHAGLTSNPSNPIYKGYNPNWNTIGIENADDKNPAGADRTNQLPALIALVADICKRNGIPADRDHICGHRELYDKKTCPGNLDVDDIVKKVRTLLGHGEVSVPDPDKIKVNIGGTFGIMEVQAIRSLLSDTRRNLTSAQQQILDLENEKKVDLENQKFHLDTLLKANLKLSKELSACQGLPMPALSSFVRWLIMHGF